ncbi:MAG: PIN domain-containing protein [Planctomycetes bacterium]|nr:PIN domain-containing protein [Planctomycetota bacterium]
MKKVLVDTSLFISWFRGQHIDLAQKVLTCVPYLSSVVATELKAGARTTKQQRQLDKMLSAYEDTDRIITPDHQTYREAGTVIAKLGVPTKSILADTLIALSARSIGAEVWTINESDFKKVQGVRQYKLNVIRK